MKTLTVYNSLDAAELQPGQTIYPVRCVHVRTGNEQLELRTQPGRTNLSHESCVSGWLGTTNDVEATALGAYEVVSVRERWLADGRQRIDGKVR